MNFRDSDFFSYAFCDNIKAARLLWMRIHFSYFMRDIAQY